MNDKAGLFERLENGIVLGAEGYVFELERRGYIKAGPFVPEVVLDEPALAASPMGRDLAPRVAAKIGAGSRPRASGAARGTAPASRATSPAVAPRWLPIAPAQEAPPARRWTLGEPPRGPHHKSWSSRRLPRW